MRTLFKHNMFPFHKEKKMNAQQCCQECGAASCRYKADYRALGGALYYFCSKECNAITFSKIGDGYSDGGGRGRKLTKDESGYVPAYPKIQCGTCIYFVNIPFLESCKIVEGPIEEAGCCNLWIPNRDQLDARGRPVLTFVGGAEAKRILGYDD